MKVHMDITNAWYEKNIIIRCIFSKEHIDFVMAVLFICGSIACGNSAGMAEIIGGSWVTSRLISIALGTALYIVGLARYTEVMGFNPLVHTLSLYLFSDGIAGNIIYTFGHKNLMPLTSFLGIWIVPFIVVVYLLLKKLNSICNLDNFYIADEGLYLISKWLMDIFLHVAFTQFGEIVLPVVLITGANPKNVAIFVLILEYCLLGMGAMLYTLYFGDRWTARIAWVPMMLFSGLIIEGHSMEIILDGSFTQIFMEALGLM